MSRIKKLNFRTAVPNYPAESRFKNALQNDPAERHLHKAERNSGERARGPPQKQQFVNEQWHQNRNRLIDSRTGIIKERKLRTF